MALPMGNFQKLKREACKASIMIEGLTGKGKSGLALMLAMVLKVVSKMTPTPQLGKKYLLLIQRIVA